MSDRAAERQVSTPQETPGIDSAGEATAAAAARWSRRAFLQLAGGSLAATAASGCFQMPPQRAMPSTEPVEGRTPGVPLSFATTTTHHGFGIGLHVLAWEGRPTKVEGNPLHPASLGAAGVFEQALITQLYDPARARAVVQGGQPTDLKGYLEAQTRRATLLQADGGAGLSLLLAPSTSPTELDLRRRIRERFPRARLRAWHALSRENLYRGAALAYGRPLEARFDLSQARVVVALDADPLGTGPWRLRAAREAAQAREPGPAMLRLYAVEPAPTITGMYADHRVVVRASDVDRFARALAAALARRGSLGELDALAVAADYPEQRDWVRRIADDLLRAGDRGLVIVGHRQSPSTVALGYAVNEALGSAARLAHLSDPFVDGFESGPSNLASLADELRAGGVDTLVVTAFDPVSNAPGDVDLAELVAAVPNGVYLAASAGDATAALAHWVVPRATVLESWGDARAVDGTASLMQPLVAPLFVAATDLDVLAPFAGLADQSPRELVRGYWRRTRAAPDFDAQFQRWLRDGVIPDAKPPELRPALQRDAVRAALEADATRRRAGSLELQFIESATLFDGRYARNGWLQELPDPVTKQVWGNAALMSESTAKQIGVGTGDPVVVAAGEAQVQLPAYVLHGAADGAVALAIGFGRPGPDESARGARVGANAAPLRRVDAFWSRGEVQVRCGARASPFITTQIAEHMHGRPIALSATWDAIQSEGDGFLHEHKGPQETLYDPVGYAKQPYTWAMAIDLNRCIGCHACVIACQAENNIPVVGPREASRGRVMHWLRVDRYFDERPTGSEVALLPLACVHCEKAPCEYVCPVNATVHSAEGINQMVYNRCVGTRFCSNNCPYKVRRFNWHAYTGGDGSLQRAARNPDVSVRGQGVMEKCTWCIQRIERARIDARIRGAKIALAGLQTACQQACPTRTIEFGSLEDRDSPVARMHRDRRHYLLLHDRGTRPRTVYLARVRNPNRES